MNFDYLQKLDTKGKTSTFYLPITGPKKEDGSVGTPRLLVRYAGESNRGWNNAVMKWNQKTGLARKALSGSTETNRLAIERDRELYPRHIVFGWQDIPDSEGNAVPFSAEACTEFIAKIPTWLFDELRLHCTMAQNFLAEDEPSDDDVQETAGK